MTVRETLTALYNYMFIGLAMYGCAMTGMPIPEDLEKDLTNTLP